MRAIRKMFLFFFYGLVALLGLLPGVHPFLVVTALFILQCCCIFIKPNNRRQSLFKEIEANLTSDEMLIAEAIELRPFALFHRRLGVAITNNRVLSLQRRILGGYKQMEEWQWRYITEVKIEKIFFRAC